MAAENGLLALGVLFGVVAAAGAVGRRTGVPAVPLYVLGGVVVGPYVAGAAGLPYVSDSETVTVLAEVGVVLLLFFLGLEFSLDRLLAARRRLSAAAGVDLLVNFPLGVALGLLFGWGPVGAFLLGGVVYVSSSAVITKSLVDLGWIADPEAEPVLGTLVAEDLVVAVYLALASALVLGGDPASAAVRVGVALAFLVVVAALAQFGARPLARALDGSDEDLVLRTMALALVVAGLALAVGASEGVAGFFVGVGVGATPLHDRVAETLAPVRDAVAAVFFAWVGLRTDPALVVAVAGPLAVAAVVTGPAKVLSGAVGGRLYDLPRRRSLRTGLALVARGEFSLVIAALAAASPDPRVAATLPAFAVGYVLVMALAGTLAMSEAARIERLLGVGAD
ncbi:cation:proton antiporter [Candidatus Halobonum tyrrellensis]|uniref:Potassium/proton antiporter membrane subunit, cpa2 family protein n=1 Tax=Candidatus Halobonum tyrrellensis G22 TaxID=1324957 RepID=V4GWL8_9EURY|nr:cation:proton antiporter [Candidatus Halobonum tyrrellensis]ESP89561.1 potassium/proton antiporter membrane subunit, cpa2 family protein [Candidatus Halobonum tyrrellensis G22]